jgi:predicted aspartyl protease
MSEPKSLAFRVDYAYKARVLKTEAILFAVSAPPPNNSLIINAIWDTGATDSVITPSVAEKLQLSAIDTVNMVGVNSEGLAPVSIVHIGLPNTVLIPMKRVSIAKIGGGADMLIGMDIISLGDFLISNANNKTVFSFVIPPFPDHPDWVERSYNINQGIT